MRTITLNSNSNPDTLLLGIRGEYNIGQIVFDYSAWETEYGEGIVTIAVKRSEDVQPYLVLPEMDTATKTATWTLTETDLLYKGRGEIEYVYTGADDVLRAKTPVFRTYVSRDIGEPTGDVPEPYETVIERMTELYTDTLTAKAEAETARAEAEAVLEQIEAMVIPQISVSGNKLVVKERSLNG